MSKLSLYYSIISPPSRFALIVAKMLELDFEEKVVDLLSGKHLTEEYRQINPSQTVPALVDGDMKMFDSNAIAIYLVEKYAKDDSLYPKNLEQRARVNEQLFYIASYLFPRGLMVIKGGLSGTLTEIPQKSIDDFNRGYEVIESFLKNVEYLSGSSLTLSDLSLWSLMESGEQIVPIDENRFPNFAKWMKKMRHENKFSQLNKEGADLHISIFKQCLEKNRAKVNSN
ncbi:hypothetical protein PVAND_004879 [Polypedilum vanderplanki]|uniref:glutathione transferase n=1 Tax=Polypedilum vanderplanki TaxID=319348 RepID=A0A9J6BYK3_POLVA|nr:hypothetical protein PVAND_004879 [Polypedilum vanderplanki]